MSTHVHNASDAVSGVHVVERVVDLVERLAVGDEFVDLQLAVHVIRDKAWQLSAALHTTERATSPDTASHKLEGSGGNLGTSGSLGKVRNGDH